MTAVQKISFPTPLEDIKDIENDNIDVFVELEDRYKYTVVLGSYKNILSAMDRTKRDFLEPGYFFIIVKKLTQEIIEQAIQAFPEEDDGYWSKFDYLSTESGMITLDTLRDKLIQ
jgi:hypothetical protein